METPQRSKLWWRHPRGLKGLGSNYPKGQTTLEVGIDDIIINEIALLFEICAALVWRFIWCFLGQMTSELVMKLVMM